MVMQIPASSKYSPFNPPDLPDRTWPSKRITKAPRWLATDLRDGNQSLAHPMNVAEKWEYFQLLVQMGFIEIDVSFPSASDTEFAFTRRLIETPGATPDDVWLQVLSPCRKELIRRTVDSVTGAKKAIISLYIASSDNFLETIFNLTQQDILDMAVDCVKYTKSITKDDPAQQGTTWNLMFSPEAFSDTDSDYAVRLCRAVKEAWEPTQEVPVILNLPATVEMCTPNTFADQVELFVRAFPDPDVIVSLHPHNDRGCAVAAAELGQLAGARRVEGCLFGNGERTGNVDLVTLALNLYTQGVDPNLDFSNMPHIRRTVERLTRIPVHTRAPYAGDSVFLAYSGSHQDAINKGFKKWEAPRTPPNQVRHWKVPYLALDPEDIGATYEAVVKVNSQSGKGGVAWTMSRSVNLDLPRGMQVDFSQVVKRESDRRGEVLSPQDIQELFLRTYNVLSRDQRILKYVIEPFRDGRVHLDSSILINGLAREVRGKGDSVPSAISAALAVGTGIQMQLETMWKSWSEGGHTRRVAVAKCEVKRGKGLVSWGASMCGDGRGELEAEGLACLGAVLELEKRIPSLRLLRLYHGPRVSNGVSSHSEAVRIRS